MLGKVQFNIQKLLDNYVSSYTLHMNHVSTFSFVLFFHDHLKLFFQRSHIAQTITVPSESLLNELRIVEVGSFYSYNYYMTSSNYLYFHILSILLQDMKWECDEKRSESSFPLSSSLFI